MKRDRQNQERKKKGRKNKGKAEEHGHVNKKIKKNKAQKPTQYAATGSSEIELSKNMRFFL